MSHSMSPLARYLCKCYDCSHANVDGSGLVGFPVTKSMTVPRHAKLELHGHQGELPDAATCT
jgi:hypothetical protein